jgi:hypothetical protein
MQALFSLFAMWSLVLSIPAHGQAVGFYSSNTIDRLLRRPTGANATALRHLLSKTPTSYQSRSKRSLRFERSDSGPDHVAWITDAEQSVKQSLAYACTGNAMFSKNAANILRGWPAVNKRFEGPNALLEAAWGTASMARAAALLTRTKAPGWSARDVERYLQWLDRKPDGLLNLMTHDYRSESWDKERRAFNNWQVSLTEARLMVSLLRSPPPKATSSEPAWVIMQFKRIVQSFVEPNGKPAELTRDLTHTQFATGGLMQIAEALRLHFGIDLFMYPDGRLAKMMEITAEALNGGRPLGMKREELHAADWVLPTSWHIALRNFRDRLGIRMPQVTRLVQRQIFDAYVFHWGMDEI